MALYKTVFIFLLISGFLLQGLPSSFGQSPNSIEVIRPEDGLSNRVVTCILQNRQGYMWFGTQNGLNRYDGHSILVLNTRSKPVSLSDNEVLHLYEDRSGMLWVISPKTLDKLNPLNLTVRNYTGDLQKATGETAVSSMGETASGFWVCTLLGKVLAMDTSGQFRLLFDLSQYWPEVHPIENGVRTDSIGNYWAVSSLGGILKLSPEGRLLKKYRVANKVMKGPFIDREGRMRLNCSDGLFLYSPRLDGFIRTEKERSGSQTCYFEDSNGDTWLVEDDYTLYKKEKGEWREQKGLKEAIAEKEAIINAVYEDLSHNIWAGTTYGVVKMPLRRDVFSTYLNTGSVAVESKRYSIRGFLEDPDGTVWLGSYGLLFHFYPGTGKMVTIPLPKNREGQTVPLTPYVFIDEGDKMWLVTEGYGLILFDKKKQTYRFPPYFSLPRMRGLPYFLISQAVDSKGRFWLGAYDGLFIREKGKDTFLSYERLYPGSPLSGRKIFAIFKPAGNEIWIGTDKGLFILDEQSLTVQKHLTALAGNELHVSVRHITGDRNGNLWIGTADDGLFQLNAKGAVLNHWTTREGMSDNTVYAILFDEGRLFCSTNNGITVIDTAKRVFSRFYTEDGLSDNEFNHGSFLKHSSGEMYFGGIDGFSRFSPSDLQSISNTSLPFMQTSYELYDGDAKAVRSHYDAGNGNLSLSLPYSNRSFAIRFALADYTRPERNEYSYMLEGHDKNWVNIGNQSFIRLVGIPPGKYTLRIKALGSDGIWNPRELNVSIAAAQIFYRTWWFIALSVLFVAGAFFAFYSYRIRHYRKVLLLRTRLASDLHDEVGSHLTGIALSSDLMKELPADQRMEKLITRISNSSRQASTKMSDVLWTIDSRSDTLESLLGRMREHAREIFEPAEIDFAIETTGLPEKQKLPMNTRHNLYLIFKEATNNIVKHAKASRVAIALQYKTGRLEMSISDNGCAAPDPERKTGQGLRNMQMRADQMNGEINISYGNGFRIHVAVKA